MIKHVGYQWRGGEGAHGVDKQIDRWAVGMEKFIKCHSV